jgi:FAD synthase
MGMMTWASSQVKRRGDDFTLKAGRQGGTRVLDRVNKFLQVRVGHVDKALADALEVETSVVRRHHH